MDYWPTGRAIHPGPIPNKIHLIRLGCPRPSRALTVPNRGLKHHSFTLSTLYIYIIYMTLNGNSYIVIRKERETALYITFMLLDLTSL